jgi:hypothetical protein
MAGKCSLRSRGAGVLRTPLKTFDISFPGGCSPGDAYGPDGRRESWAGAPAMVTQEGVAFAKLACQQFLCWPKWEWRRGGTETAAQGPDCIRPRRRRSGRRGCMPQLPFFSLMCWSNG